MKRNLDAEALAEFTAKASVLDELYHRVGELEETLDALDHDIEYTTDIGLDELASQMCKSRNKLNIERLNLDIEIHKLELDLDEFEKIRMMTR
jgi:hypothetical protein